MKQSSKNFLSPLNIFLITVCLGIATYVYYGFYFNDPTIFLVHPYGRIILKSIKLFFPIITISLIFIYRAIYLKKLPISSFFLLLFSLFFFMFLIYPFVNYFYNGSSEEKSNRLDDFHAYLQINPPALKNLDSNKFNIFCLGGSTTEYKDSLGRDWPGLVEKKLNNKLQYEHVELFNYGKAWYSTQHILINYILNLKQYKPNAIIVMENINDLLQNADFSWLSKGKFRDDYGNFLGPMTRILKYGDFATFITKEIKGMWYQSKTAYVETNKFPGLKSFERNLNILISLAKEDSTKIILMTQPNIYKDSMNVNERNALHMLDNEAIGNGKKWTYKTALIGIRQYNQKIREIAFSRNIPLIDLDKIVPKNLEYFYDDVHYNYKTYDLIAAYIAQELENILKNDK